jgi:hypothetical protein
MENTGLSANTIKQLEERREKAVNGDVNCILSPFKRFRNDFFGIEQDTYYCITSFTKGGKSQFTSYTFIFRTIITAYYSKKKLDFKIIYFPLEETKERILQRFMSWLLYRFSKGKIRVSPSELRSTISPVSKDVLDKLKTQEIQNLLKFFEEHIIFPEEGSNPTGIYKYCKQYAEEHGTVKTKTIKKKDEFGVEQEYEKFYSYTQDNPNEYRMIIIDTINLIDCERGMSLKQSIDKLSEYCAKYLRNRYHYSPIIIQQQAFDSESNDAFKIGKVRPSVAGLGDSKYTSRDANIVLGLFSPFRFGLTEYFDYDITRLKDHIRFLEVIVNRDGEMGGLLPLWFDGAVCDFRELPKSNDTQAMAKVYAECRRLEQQKSNTPTIQKSNVSTVLLLIINYN